MLEEQSSASQRPEKTHQEHQRPVSITGKQGRTQLTKDLALWEQHERPADRELLALMECSSEVVRRDKQQDNAQLCSCYEERHRDKQSGWLGRGLSL